MSVQDMIKKSILKSENFTSQNAVKILATLLLAIALGAFIYFVYQRFFLCHNSLLLWLRYLAGNLDESVRREV